MSYPSKDPRPTQHFRAELPQVAAIEYICLRDGADKAVVLRRLIDDALRLEAQADPTITAIVQEDNR